MKGLFLSLDGVDGAGKSTQCQLLADWLRSQGHDVHQCVDPGGTALGAELRHIVLHHRGQIARTCEALLFMSSRAQLVQEVIRPALELGKTVVSDRYLLANVVYQGYGAGLDVDELWRVGAFATSGILPDLTLVLDLPLHVALLRRKAHADRMESRDVEFHRRVREGFLAEAHRHSERVEVVDASASETTVQTKLREIVAKHLQTRSTG